MPLCLSSTVLCLGMDGIGKGFLKEVMTGGILTVQWELSKGSQLGGRRAFQTEGTA